LGKIIENSDQLALVKNENVEDCGESNHEFYKYLPVSIYITVEMDCVPFLK